MTLKFIIFDLDETLYPRGSGLMQEISRRIQLWVQRRFDLTWEEASAMRHDYFIRYGTTLGGLIVEHDVDVDDYLFFVHDVPAENYLAPNPALAVMLDAIPLRKAVYTNGTSGHGRRVLRVLGVADRFEQLSGIEEAGLRSKAYRDAYERVLAQLGARGDECIMVEDIARNLRAAKELGLTTVLVDAEPDENVDFAVGSVLEVGDVVNDLLRSRQEVERITRYLDVRTAAPEHADLVFVFGTSHPEPARVAADMVKRGIGRYVVLTGGNNRLTGLDEANAHLEIVLKSGVARECIIIESESTNTLENVVLALPKIKDRVDLGQVKSIAVVTKWYHCRRAMMTLKHHLPAGVRYFAVTYEPEGIGRSDWQRSERGSRRVWKEWGNIPKYVEAGDIEEIQKDGGAVV